MENIESENSSSDEEISFGDRQILFQYHQQLRAVELAKQNGEDPLTAPDVILCGTCDATFNKMCDYNRHMILHEYIIFKSEYYARMKIVQPMDIVSARNKHTFGI